MLANRNLSWQFFLTFWVTANIIALFLTFACRAALADLIVLPYSESFYKQPYLSLLGAVLIIIMIGIIFGTMQWIVLRLKIPKVNWWRWVLVTTCGITLGLLFFSIALLPIMFAVGGIFDAINVRNEEIVNEIAVWTGWLVGALFLGTTVGMMQSLILRQKVTHPSLWVVANIVGMALVAAICILVVMPVWTGFVENIAVSIEDLESRISIIRRNIIFKGVIMGGIIGAAFGIPTGVVLLRLLYFSPSQKNA